MVSNLIGAVVCIFAGIGFGFSIRECYVAWHREPTPQELDNSIDKVIEDRQLEFQVELQKEINRYVTEEPSASEHLRLIVDRVRRRVFGGEEHGDRS